MGWQRLKGGPTQPQVLKEVAGVVFGEVAGHDLAQRGPAVKGIAEGVPRGKGLLISAIEIVLRKIFGRARGGGIKDVDRRAVITPQPARFLVGQEHVIHYARRQLPWREVGGVGRGGKVMAKPHSMSQL